MAMKDKPLQFSLRQCFGQRGNNKSFSPSPRFGERGSASTSFSPSPRFGERGSGGEGSSCVGRVEAGSADIPSPPNPLSPKRGEGEPILLPRPSPERGNGGPVCLTAFLLTVVVAIGCDAPPPVTTYRIPTVMPAALLPETNRMVAAIVPTDDSAWFFKILGPQSAVDPVAKDLKNYVQTVEFKDGNPVLTDLPEGWKVGGARRMRFASVTIDTPGKQLDLSISKLGRRGDWDSLVADNVNRWRGQVGLQPSEEKFAGAELLDRPGDDPSIWVDVAGEVSASGPSMTPPFARSPPPFAAATPPAGDPHAGLPRNVREAAAQAKAEGRPPPTSMPEPTGAASPLQVDAPTDWRPGRMSTMRMAAYDAGPEDAAAEATVIIASGDLRSNVARWIGQVIGDSPDDELVDRVIEQAEKRTVSGRDGQRFVLMPDDLGKPDATTAIDATIVPIEGGQSLFIKMTGPPTTLAEQSDAMGTFLDSVRYNP